MTQANGDIARVCEIGRSADIIQGCTDCSAAIRFMPSNNGPVTFSFRYLLAGAPCGAALAGIGIGTGVAAAVGVDVLSGGCVPLRTGVEFRTEGVDILVPIGALAIVGS